MKGDYVPCHLASESFDVCAASWSTGKDQINVAIIILFLSPVGYSLIAINGQTVANKMLPDGRSAAEVLAGAGNYPLSLKFTRLRASINERIMLLSMFHS